MRRILLLLALLLTPLHLEATSSRAELLKGDQVTISAYLFNDGAEATQGEIGIVAPPGFVLEHAENTSGVILPGCALHASFTYRVLASPGLYTFVVSGGESSVPVTIRVGPVVAPPAVWRRHRVWFPVFRA